MHFGLFSTNAYACSYPEVVADVGGCTRVVPAGADFEGDADEVVDDAGAGVTVTSMTGSVGEDGGRCRTRRRLLPVPASVGAFSPSESGARWSRSVIGFRPAVRRGAA